jgi:hypothetical protein
MVRLQEFNNTEASGIQGKNIIYFVNNFRQQQRSKLRPYHAVKYQNKTKNFTQKTAHFH